MQNRVKIKRADVTYLVAISKLSQLASTLKRVGARDRRACVIIDQGFAKARPDVLEILRKIYPASKNLFLEVAGDESSKSWESAGQILGKMIDAGFTRKDLCVSVGGGVVGDLGGFVASLYHRGIDVVHVPTTLLAMVDSSVGGKTAVNHLKGKNLIGTFHQPRAVVQVLDFLTTLPEEEFKSGLGEVFKYAVGFSPRLFRYLELNSEKVLKRDPAVLVKILGESIEIKAKVVSADERETGGEGPKGRSRFSDRRLLNFGHTLGHGLEKAYGLPHGVAVAVGVTLAAKLSVKVNLCPQKCYDQVMGLAHKLSLKTDFEWTLEEILPYVKRDKKMVAGRIQFVCLKKIGHAVVRSTKISELMKVTENGRY